MSRLTNAVLQCISACLRQYGERKTNISDAQGRTVSQCDIPLSKVDSAILQWISSFVIGKQIESHLLTLSWSKFNLIHHISAIQLNLSNRTFLGAIFLFRLDKCSVYTGYINIIFLHWDFTQSWVKIGFQCMQGSAYRGLTVYDIWFVLTIKVHIKTCVMLF